MIDKKVAVEVLSDDYDCLPFGVCGAECYHSLGTVCECDFTDSNHGIYLCGFVEEILCAVVF